MPEDYYSVYGVTRNTIAGQPTDDSEMTVILASGCDGIGGKNDGI